MDSVFVVRVFLCFMRLLILPTGVRLARHRSKSGLPPIAGKPSSITVVLVVELVHQMRCGCEPLPPTTMDAVYNDDNYVSHEIASFDNLQAQMIRTLIQFGHRSPEHPKECSCGGIAPQRIQILVAGNLSNNVSSILYCFTFCDSDSHCVLIDHTHTFCTYLWRHREMSPFGNGGNIVL